MSGNHKTKSAVLFRLLKQIEAPKKDIGLSERPKQNEKSGQRIIVSKIEINLQFPMLFQQSMIPIYHCEKEQDYYCP